MYVGDEINNYLIYFVQINYTCCCSYNYYNVPTYLIINANVINIPLSTMSSYEYLDLILDNKLNMFQQVENMYKNANARLGIVREIGRFISERTAVKIYKSMTRPHVEY